MNATVLTEDGEIFTRIHELTIYACTRCERGGGLATRQVFLEVGGITLATFEHGGEVIAAPAPCSCGGDVRVFNTAVAYVPDEAELPALFRVGDEGWLLAPLERPAADDSAAHAKALALAMNSPDRVWLDDISEAELSEQWGRPLSVGSHWLQVCMTVLASGARDVRDDPAPGLTLTVNGQRLAECNASQAAEIEQAVNEQLLELGADAIACSPLRASWASPICGELRRHASIGFADLSETRDRLAAAIAQYRLDTALAPDGRDDEHKIWLRVGELVAGIREVDVAATALAAGRTLAEAATAAVLRRSWELTRANVALDRIRGMLGPKRAATIKPFAIDNIGVDGHEHGFNLESILAKCWWNPASDEFAEVIGRFLAPRDASRPLAEALCPCGTARPFLHLRPLDGPGHAYRTIQDFDGETFALISTMDCPHAIAHIPADAIAKEFGGNADDSFARGIRQTSLRVSARALRGFDNRVEAIVVSCDSVASLLAHEHLGSALARAFSARLRSREMWALALTTNLIVLLPRRAEEEHPNATWFEIAARDAVADPMVAQLGYRLMFVAKLDATARAAGSITIDWSEATSPVAA